MGILDQLMERKDLFIYIDERIEEIRHLIEVNNVSKTPKNRSKINIRHHGRIRELKRLKHLLYTRTLKEQCKIHYNVSYWVKDLIDEGSIIFEARMNIIGEKDEKTNTD